MLKPALFSFLLLESLGFLWKHGGSKWSGLQGGKSQRQLFLQLTTGSRTERVLFNLEEQAVTKVLVVNGIIYSRNQTSNRNKDVQVNNSCPVSWASTHELCSASLEDSPATRGLTQFNLLH